MSFITAIAPDSRQEWDYDSRVQAYQGLNYTPSMGDVASAFVGDFLTEGGAFKSTMDWLRIKTDTSNEISEEDFNSSPLRRDDITWHKGMTEGELKIINEHKTWQEKSSFIRSNASGMQSALGWTLGIASAFVDPVNIVTSFIPVPGVSSRIALQVGKGALGKTTGRLIQGAAEGAVGTAYTEPLMMYVSNELQDDYTMADSLASIAFGGFIGSALHVGIGKIGDMVDHGISRRTHVQAHQTAVGQIMSGKAVDVQPIIETGRFDNAARVVSKQEVALVEGRLQPWKPAAEFQLGNMKGVGKAAKYTEYSPVAMQDRHWLEGVKYELLNSSGGARVFREVDGQGSTDEIMGYKGNTPEWFTRYNEQADQGNKARKRAKRDVKKGKITEDSLPPSYSILTREKAAKVIDKLLEGKPLGKAEGEIAQTVMAEARARREENVRQMLDVRGQRQAHEKMAGEMRDYAAQEGPAWFDRQQSVESDSTYNAQASQEIDAIHADDDMFNPNNWDSDIADLEAELAEIEALGYMEPEELAELDRLRAEEAEAKDVGEAFRAASICMTKNGA